MEFAKEGVTVMSNKITNNHSAVLVIPVGFLWTRDGC